MPLDHCPPGAPRKGQAALEIAGRAALPVDRLLENERREALRLAIRELPEIYRTVVLLRDFEELSTEETAQALDLTGDAIKTRLRRARQALRQRLGEPMKEGALRNLFPNG